MNKSGDSETSGSEASFSGLSPLGKSRYGRTRKPKISEDFCNIDDLFNDSTPQKLQRSPQKSPVQKVAGKSVASPLSVKTVEIDSLFMPKQIQPLPKQITPQRTHLDDIGVDIPKIVSVPLKERKFFKSNSEVSAGDGVDVTEVLKIIKSDHSESPIDIPKPTTKSTLRTYGNKRKLTVKKEVIESFALPDNPIVPASINKELDVDLPVSTEKKELPTNNIDIIQENDVNNCTLKLNYNVVFDQICIKADECMLKSTPLKTIHDESTTHKSAAKLNDNDSQNDIEEQKEVANGAKERKRKKMSLNISNVEEVAHASKKSKFNKTVSATKKEKNSINLIQKPISGVSDFRLLKRKRGRPGKNKNLTRSQTDLNESTASSTVEEKSETNLSPLRKAKKIKKIDDIERNSKNTETPLKNSIDITCEVVNIEKLSHTNKRRIDKILNASHKQQTKNTKTANKSINQSLEKQPKFSENTSPEKQLRSGKIVNINVEEKRFKKDSLLETTISLEKSLKKEKLDEVSEENVNKTPQKSPKKKRLRSGADFVSPRLLRSSVILIEPKPAEIVDLTGNDADEENSEEEKQNESKVRGNGIEKQKEKKPKITDGENNKGKIEGKANENDSVKKNNENVKKDETKSVENVQESNIFDYTKVKEEPTEERKGSYRN